MKAPDKIYMPNELLSEEWSRHIEGEDTEYIRKEALLEWVKNKAQDITGINYEEDNYEAGKAHALWEVIDKINSL